MVARGGMRVWLLGGMHGCGGMRGCRGACVGYDDIWSMSRRYASYWNAFLLILIESSKSKNQVVHEQKFEGPLSRTCQISPEKMLEVVRGLCSICIGGNILSLDFFHVVKPLMRCWHFIIVSEKKTESSFFIILV